MNNTKQKRMNRLTWTGYVLVVTYLGLICCNGASSMEPPDDAGPYPGECKHLWISDLDGHVQATDYYSYDASNNLVYIDASEKCTAFTYGDDNLLLTSVEYDDCDENYSRNCTEYEYDEAGIMTGYREDYSCNDSYIRCYALIRSDDGQVAEMQRSDDCSDYVDYRETYTYDTYGSVVTVDAWSDGTNDTCYSYTYDDAENLITGARDDVCDEDGNEYLWELTYDCWSWGNGGWEFSG